MSSQKLELAIKGLYTSPNNLSGTPPGALQVANNVVINSKNVADSRRGQTQYNDPLTIGGGQINKLFNYASSLIVSYDNKLAYDNGSGSWVDYSGTYSDPATGYRMRSLEALKNFYYTTSEGVFKLDALTAVPRKSGVVRALGGTYQINGTSGFLPDNSAVAYRIVWGYRDANNNLILGSPSQRIIAINSSGNPTDIQLTFTIPSSITTEYFYQIYRSNATVTATDQPSDELQLVIEDNPSSSDITAKEITVLDQTPFSLMRTTLYTSPSLEGIANANDEPPLALDMDIFKGCAFYANIKQKQRLTLALISVDSPSLGYVTQTGDTSIGVNEINNLADTTVLRVGMRVIGTGFAGGCTIISIDTATKITVSDQATATNVGISFEFQDRFTIGLVDYWAGSTQDVATNTFLLDNSGTPAQNINASALNLLEIINTSASNTTLYGYYTSSTDDLPGQMLFEERSIGGVPFFATSTCGTSFSPPLPEAQQISGNTVANPTVVTTVHAHGLTTGDLIQVWGSNSTPSLNGQQIVTVISPTTFSVPVHVTLLGNSGYFVLNSNYVVSNNDARQNRVAISKQGQVEAVPIYTYFDIGSANFPIQRVVALRDGIFFFKTDGVYRLSGEIFSNFTVNLIDNTVALKAPETAVPFNNQVFCFTTQGVCAVTDSGVQLLSVPIEDTLLELASDQFTHFSTASFGVAYESARLYLFFTVSKVDDTFATQAFVYNSLTESWTVWPLSRTCGVVNTTVNKLFMAQPDTGQVVIERKSFTNADYADEQYNVTITTVTSTTLISLSSVTNVEIGMTIVQAGSRKALIEDINGLDLTISAVNGMIAGAAIVYTPIMNELQWLPIDAANPGILKQFSEISLFFKNAAFLEIDAEFSTNISIAGENIPLISRPTTGWGRLPWSRGPWGSVLGGQSVVRTYVPREKQRGHWLNLKLATNEAFTGFSLQGVSLIFNQMSSRFK